LFFAIIAFSSPIRRDHFQNCRQQMRNTLGISRAASGALERTLGRVIPFLFPCPRGRRAGERRQDYRKAAF
jgi:hypothetical protein